MKPITERIRRERINNSLYQLKSLVLSAMNKDVSLAVLNVMISPKAGTQGTSVVDKPAAYYSIQI
jgi:hypothetical protein